MTTCWFMVVNPQIKSRSRHIYIADARPCDLLDLKDHAIPNDFSVSFRPGVSKSEQRSWTISTLLPDRRLQEVTYTLSSSRPRGHAAQATATSDRRVSQDQLLIFWNALAACGFSDMQSSYVQPGFNRKYVIPSHLTITANGKSRSVYVSPRAFMGRFEYLTSMFKGMIPNQNIQSNTMTGAKEK